MAYQSLCSGIVLAGLLLAAGCGEDAPPVRSGPSGDGPVSDAGPTGPCQDFDEQSCTCEGTDGGPPQSGVSSCYMETWLSCNCYAQLDDLPENNEGACKAGR